MSHCSSTLSGGTNSLTVAASTSRRIEPIVSVISCASSSSLRCVVDHLALVVGDVVVLEQLLADVEVARLDLALRVLDRARDHARLDGLALGHLQRAHDRLQALAGEDLEQRILEREEEARAARVALAAGAAAQLVVDAARLVALGADDVQPARGHDVVVQLLPRFSRTVGDAAFLCPNRRAPRRPSARGSRDRDCRPARCPCRGRPCSWRL